MTVSCQSKAVPPRRGFASVWTLVVLAVVSALLATVAAQLLTNRRELYRQQERTQSLWLARSGIELAAGRLLTDPDGYRGEAVEVVPGTRVRVEVRAEAPGTNVYQVTSAALHPGAAGGPAYTLTRRFKRTAEGGKARLEGVAPGPGDNSDAPDHPSGG
jgi:type II secretory pathway pseudopilin PulG